MKKLVVFSLVLCGLTTSVSAQSKKVISEEKSKSIVTAEKSVQENKKPDIYSDLNSTQVLSVGRTKADRLRMKQLSKKD